MFELIVTLKTIAEAASQNTIARDTHTNYKCVGCPHYRSGYFGTISPVCQKCEKVNVTYVDAEEVAYDLAFVPVEVSILPF